MIEIRRILCPIDFSNDSRHALAHAIAVAKWYGAAITLLHVSHPEAFTNPPLLFDDLPRGAAMIESTLRAAEEEMPKWSQSVTAAGAHEEADARLTIVHVFDWQPDDDMMTARFDTAEYVEAVERQGVSGWIGWSPTRRACGAGSKRSRLMASPIARFSRWPTQTMST